MVRAEAVKVKNVQSSIREKASVMICIKQNNIKTELRRDLEK